MRPKLYWLWNNMEGVGELTLAYMNQLKTIMCPTYNRIWASFPLDVEVSIEGHRDYRGCLIDMVLAVKGMDFLERAMGIFSNQLPRGVQAFTASNFQANFSRLMYGGSNLLRGSGMQVHHALQKGGEVGEWLLSRGINPNNPLFGVLMDPKKHQAIKGAFEAEWTQFMTANQHTATLTQILQFAQYLGDKFGYRANMLF